MKKLFVAALCATVVPMAAHAAVLTFDDLPGAGSPYSDPAVPNGYGGFDYNNFYYLDPTMWAPIWDAGAAQSSPLVAVNGFGAPAVMTRGTAFNFVSAYFANGLNAVTITIDGRDAIGGSVTHTATFDTSASPSLQTFNWTGVQELDFSAAPTNGGTSHFSMDDVSYALSSPSAVPEPAAWGLMILGLGGIGAVVRHRANAASATA